MRKFLAAAAIAATVLTGCGGGSSGSAVSKIDTSKLSGDDKAAFEAINGKLAEDQRPLVVYAHECDPKTNPDYWHYKRQHFGADDGIEFLDAEMLMKLITGSPAATHLTITMTDASLSVSLIRR